MENTEFQRTPTISETPIISEPSLKPVESLSKSKNYWILIAIIAILFVLVLYLLYLNFNKSSTTITSTSTPKTGIIPTETVTPTTDPTADWQTYTNSKNGFSFKYPSTYLESKINLPENYLTMLQGNDYKLVTNGFGSMNTGSYYYLSLNERCLPQDIVGDKKVISTDQNITIYKITGYEGPDYKSAIIKNSNKCFELSCSSESKCDGRQFTEFSQILSTFKFTEIKAEIPQPISDLFAKINRNFGLNLVPIAENEFYSPSGMIIKKSWKIDFVNTTLGKSLSSFLRQQLEPNDAESGGIGGGGTDAYQNNQIKCFHTYGYRSGNPTNWTDPFNYLSCAEK